VLPPIIRVCRLLLRVADYGMKPYSLRNFSKQERLFQMSRADPFIFSQLLYVRLNDGLCPAARIYIILGGGILSADFLALLLSSSVFLQFTVFYCFCLSIYTSRALPFFVSRYLCHLTPETVSRAAKSCISNLGQTL
jgi:hypothetical protein